METVKQYPLVYLIMLVRWPSDSESLVTPLTHYTQRQAIRSLYQTYGLMLCYLAFFLTGSLMSPSLFSGLYAPLSSLPHLLEHYLTHSCRSLES